MIKKSFECIISFILAISITCLIIIMILSSTILSKAYIKSKMSQTKYYEKMYNTVTSNIQNYIGPSGLEEEDFEGIVTIKKVEEDTDIILDNIYSGIIEEVNTDEIKNTLKEKLEDVYSKRSVETSSSIKSKKKVATSSNSNDIKIDESIEQYINKISDTYINTVLHTDYEKRINKVMTKIIKIMNIAKKVLACEIAVLLVIILAMNYKTIFKGLASMCVPILAAGILLEIVNLFIRFKINIGNILILNEAISKVIQEVIGNILYKFERYGLIMMGVSVAVIIVVNIINNYNKETEKH